jgi:hypothetical protein
VSEKGNETVFDRYSKRSQPKVPDNANKPSLVPVENAGEDAPPGANELPMLDVYGHEEEDGIVQGGVYKAAFIFKSKNRQRLRVHYANGLRVKVLSYAYLIEVVSTSHQWLTLVFSSTVITLKGRHLDQLVESIQAERVLALVCFRPGIHPEPGKHEPCILEIEEQSLNQLVSEMAG